MKTRTLLCAAVGICLVATGSAQRFSSIYKSERYFNDNPLSVLKSTDQYPKSLKMDESNLNVNINRHVYYFSEDGGANPSLFNNTEYWNISTDVTINHDPVVYRQEAGIYFNYNGWDGQMMVASDGEVAVFGYILPFHTFGNIYTEGTTIRIGIRYFNDPNDGLNKLEYYAGNNSVVYTPGNTEQGLLDGTKLGFYAQDRGDAGNPTETHIRFSHIVAGLDPDPFANVQINERVFNDTPGSVLTTTNSYPDSIQFAETGLNNGLNRHLWYFSPNGVDASLFGNTEYWNVAMDVTIQPTPSGPRRQEAGMYFNYNGWDGQFMVASDGEIAIFGYILPFYKFKTTYAVGTTITIGMRYFNDPCDGKNKLEYYAGNESKVVTPDNGEQGLLTGTKLGAYCQHGGSLAEPHDVTSTFSHIVGVHWFNSTASSIGGAVSLDLFSGDPSILSGELELRDPDTNAVLNTYGVTLESDGTYTVPSVVPGTYDVAFKLDHFLREVSSSVEIGAGCATADFNQINGDADGNNQVALPDLNQLFINFASTTEPGSDLDGSGQVDLGDINAVFLNFAMVGAP